jgi:hypothetical protein
MCTPLPASAFSVAGKGGDQRLALARLHFGDIALMEEDPSHELHVEGAQAQRAARALAHQGEALGQQRVEVLAGPRPLAQGGGRVLEPLVAQRPGGLLAGVDRRHDRPHGLDLAVVGGAENAPRERAQAHLYRPRPRVRRVAGRADTPAEL